MTAGTDLYKLVQQSKGFVRTNQFRVLITPPRGMISPPDGLETVSMEDVNRVSMSCKKTSLPGFSIDTQDTNLGGTVVSKIASEVVYPDMDFQFYMSGDYVEKDFFDTWRKLIVDTPTGHLGYYDEYVTDIIIQSISRNDRVLKTYRLLEAFPSTVGDVDMSYDSENELAILNVAFKYREYEYDTSVDSTGASTTNITTPIRTVESVNV